MLFRAHARPPATGLLQLVLALLLLCASTASAQARRSASSKAAAYRRAACPDYADYSTRKHGPYTDGTYQLPYQRPAAECRLFVSAAADALIADVTERMADPDLARLFENCYPNTLDTTVRWHVDKDADGVPQSFIITGDITAQWLRDSTNQLKQYQSLAASDDGIKTLIKGAINTQVGFVLESPYCNAFQPPPASGLAPTSNGQEDTVHPAYDPSAVFECKYELDSLAHFLSLSNQYFAATGDTSFVSSPWLSALQNVLDVLDAQGVATFARDGAAQDPTYTFQRQTTLGTETLALAGRGNPLAANTSLVRSAFRPSDDATILQYFIPANAMMAVELARTADLLAAAKQSSALVDGVRSRADAIRGGVERYGIVDHPAFGRVYAFEVDGYGGRVLMDDANVPSLLALPLLGAVDVDDDVYRNTKRMVLSAEGNPYFIRGDEFEGIGGPHIGLSNAWPLSLLIQVQLSDDDDEILRLLDMVLKVSPLGLINESVNVDNTAQYTRSWFAWANSVYAQTILDLADRKPDLIFGPKKTASSSSSSSSTAKKRNSKPQPNPQPNPQPQPAKGRKKKEKRSS